MGRIAGMDDMEKPKFLTLPRLEHQHLGRPARSQSLYRLRYRGSIFLYKHSFTATYFDPATNSYFTKQS
jgi:hypothetical protein